MTSLPLFPTGPLSGPLSADAPPKKELRPYQDLAIRKLMVLVSGGTKRILLVAPCASGKMVLVSYIIRTATVPVLFVCHLRELVEQCVNELAAQGVHNVGVIRGDDDRYNPHASIQVASIQTLARRQPISVAPGIILLDEAHHCASDSYIRLFRQYPDAIFIGFSASPSRLDGKPLGGDLFQHLEVVATYFELLKRPDWLVAPDIFSSPLKPDLSEVETLGGDFQEDQLGIVMSAQPLVGDAVGHWLKLAHKHPVLGPVRHVNARGRMVTTLERLPNQSTDGERRRTFAFCSNIHHSMVVAEAFERAGARVAHLDGKTPSDQRKAMLADMRSGKLEVICNCNILLEGVDLPSLKCVVHCRPTQSLVLWMQSTARAFRPYGDITPLILDHAGNFDRHYAPHEDRQWSLVHKPIRKPGAITLKLCRNCYAYVQPHKILCPYCGSEFPKQEPKTPQQTEEELVRRSADPMDTRRSLFTKMALLARSRGYKPGFASARFLEHYGTWPPRDWSEGLKALFASDEKWQALNARREERKKLEAEEEREWNKLESGDTSEIATGQESDGTSKLSQCSDGTSEPVTHCEHDRLLTDSCHFCYRESDGTSEPSATKNHHQEQRTAYNGTTSSELEYRAASDRTTLGTTPEQRAAANCTTTTTQTEQRTAPNGTTTTTPEQRTASDRATSTSPMQTSEQRTAPNSTTTVTYNDASDRSVDPWDLPVDQRFPLLTTEFISLAPDESDDIPF